MDPSTRRSTQYEPAAEPTAYPPPLQASSSLSCDQRQVSKTGRVEMQRATLCRTAKGTRPPARTEPPRRCRSTRAFRWGCVGKGGVEGGDGIVVLRDVGDANATSKRGRVSSNSLNRHAYQHRRTDMMKSGMGEGRTHSYSHGGTTCFP